jgi:hypothetical protein
MYLKEKKKKKRQKRMKKWLTDQETSSTGCCFCMTNSMLTTFKRNFMNSTVYLKRRKNSVMSMICRELTSIN